MSLRALLSKGYRYYQAVRYPRFNRLKAATKGMLSPLVYKRIYDAVYQLPDLDIIEVGGASGGGSITIASALRDSGKKSKLIVAEKCQGGSREDVGDYQTNLDVLKSNSEKFGVDASIVIYPKEVTFETGSEVLDLTTTEQLAGLVLDADGRIDRDFSLFWPRLMPGGLIIIDDYKNHGKYLPISERHPTGGMKCLICYRLLNQFMEWGLFKLSHISGITAFGYKPEGADFSQLDLQACQKILDEIELERLQHLQGSAK